MNSVPPLLKSIKSFIYTILLLVSCTIPMAAQPYFPVKKNQLWGLITKEGKIIHDPQYEAMSSFDQFGYAVVQKQGNVGILNNLAQLVLPVVNEDVRILDSLLFSIKKEQGWVLINQKQEQLISGAYQEIKRIDKGLFLLKKDNLWGIAKADGTIIANPQFEEIQKVTDQQFLVYNEKRQKGVLLISGELVLKPAFDELLFLKNGLILAKSNSQWGILDQMGKMNTKMRYKAFDFMSDHYIRLYTYDETHLFSLPCKRVIAEEKANNFLPLSSSFVLLKKQGKIGLIDFCGSQVLATVYDEILWYNKSTFRVKKEGKWALVQKGDIPKTPFQYQHISPLMGQLALFRRAGKVGIINASTEEVVHPLYAHIEINGNTAKAYQNKSEKEVARVDLLKFDTRGKLTGDLSIEKHYKVRIGAGKNFGAGQDTEQSAYILPKYEWFYESESDRWGLRGNQSGDVQIVPTFEEVEVFSQLGFTLVGLPNGQDFEWERTTIRLNKIYGLVDNDSGRLLGRMQYRHIFMEDFEQGYPFARCILTDGTYALLARNGQLSDKRYTYIGNFKNGIARTARGGALMAGMQNPFAIGGLHDYLLDLKTPFTLIDNTTYDELLLNKGVIYCEQANWSYIDSLGQEIGEDTFDFVIDMVNSVGMVYNNGKWGLMGSNGRLIIPCAYDDLTFLENTDNQIVKLYVRKTRYGLIDTLGQLTINAIYDEIGSIREGRLAVMQNGQWGFANQEGNLIIPCQYDDVRSFHEGLAAVRTGNNWGYIDRSGKTLISAKYKTAGDFSNGLAAVEENSLLGYIDTLGNYRIQPLFKEARTFNQGIAIIKKEGLYGIIDTKGAYLQKPRYQYIEDFDLNGLAIVQTVKGKDRYGVIDRQANIISTTFYREILPYSEGLAVVKSNEKFGYIDTKAKLVIPCQFVKANPFSQGRAAVYKDGNCGFIDINGVAVTNYAFSRCQDFSDDRAVVYRGMRKAGLVDLEGNLVLEPSINQLLNFSEGRGLVRDQEYRFYYITEEADLYQGFYEKAKEFQNGVAVIQMDKKWGVINRKGITLVRPKYSRITNFENGYAKVEIDGVSGLSDINGEMIVKPGFEYISYAGSGLFRVEQGDQIGYFDQAGNWVWKLQR